MIAAQPIAQLEESLRRARSGDAPDGEIVRWLRAVSELAAGVPRPAPNPNRGYTRTLLHKNDRFEILVLHWNPNVSTAIHDHGGALCWFAVADGCMGIENFLRLDGGKAPGVARIGLEGREEIQPGGIDYRSDDLHLHRCITREQSATTLHVYANPIDRFNAFDERTGAYSEMTSSYDARL